MQKNYSLWQRITSDTPAFFVWLQRLGIGLAALGTELAQLNYLPQNYCAAIISIGGTMAVVSQFAVKQCEPLKPISHDEIEQHR